MLRANNTKVGSSERRKMKPSVIINCVHLEIYSNEITEEVSLWEQDYGGCGRFKDSLPSGWNFPSRNVQLIVINRSCSTTTNSGNAH